MSKHKRHITHRTNPQALAATIITRGLTIRSVARLLNMPRKSIERMVYTPTPITFKTACRLRSEFGRRVVDDEAWISDAVIAD